MGWASANDIFDRTAKKIIELDISSMECTQVLEELIEALQDEGWDTEDESLKRFAYQPVVVEAFARCGIAHIDDE